MATVVVKQHQEDINKYTFTGVLSSKKENEKILTANLRTTTITNGNSHTNYPKLVVFDKQCRAKVNAIPVGCRVEATGFIHSVKPKKDENGRIIVEENLPLQSFTLTDIKPVERNTPMSNNIEILGTVDEAFVTKSALINIYVIAWVKDNNGKRYMKRIRTEIFPKKAQKGEDAIDYIQFMVPGARVHIKGHCSTAGPKITINEEKRINEAIEIPREFVIVDEIEKA